MQFETEKWDLFHVTILILFQKSILNLFILSNSEISKFKLQFEFANSTYHRHPLHVEIVHIHLGSRPSKNTWPRSRGPLRTQKSLIFSHLPLTAKIITIAKFFSIGLKSGTNYTVARSVARIQLPQYVPHITTELLSTFLYYRRTRCDAIFPSYAVLAWDRRSITVLPNEREKKRTNLLYLNDSYFFGILMEQDSRPATRKYAELCKLSRGRGREVEEGNSSHTFS